MLLNVKKKLYLQPYKRQNQLKSNHNKLKVKCRTRDL